MSLYKQFLAIFSATLLSGTVLFHLFDPSALTWRNIAVTGGIPLTAGMFVYCCVYFLFYKSGEWTFRSNLSKNKGRIPYFISTTGGDGIAIDRQNKLVTVSSKGIIVDVPFHTVQRFGVGSRACAGLLSTRKFFFVEMELIAGGVPYLQIPLGAKKKCTEVFVHLNMSLNSGA